MFPNYEHFRQTIVRTEGDLTTLKGKYSKPVRVAILQFITGKKYKRNEATFTEMKNQLMIYTECPENLSPEEIDEHIYQRVLNYNAREIKN